MSDKVIPDFDPTAEGTSVKSGAAFGLVTDASIGKRLDVGLDTYVLYPTGNQEPGAAPNFEFAKVEDDIDPRLPSTIRESVVVQDGESFVRYAERYADDQFAMFAAPQPGPGDRPMGYSIIGYFDYHKQAQTMPDRLRHRVVWPMQFSEELLRWNGLAARGVDINQRAFLLFLEENLVDISNPPGAEIMDLIGRLSILRKARVDSAQRLSDGQVQISYVEEVESGGGKSGNVTMPSEIEIAIPIFVRSPIRWTLKVLLRHNQGEGGKILFGIVLHRLVFALDRALFEEVATIESALGRWDEPDGFDPARDARKPQFTIFGAPSGR